MAVRNIFLVTLLAVVAKCEPPVHGYNYQPPSTNYGTPINRPSTSYGAPNTHHNAPNPSYGQPSYHQPAPNTEYGAPGYSSGFSSPSTGYGAPSQGSYDHEHGHGHDNEVPKSYEFGYSVKDAQSGNDYDRKEVSDGNTVRGEYRVQLPDGRVQIVSYHADWQTGFHADVRYEGEAQYPQQMHGAAGGYLPPLPEHQGSYNAPDYSGSLTGFHGHANKPSTAYGPPGYQH